jgi:hypothetical protein
MNRPPDGCKIAWDIISHIRRVIATSNNPLGKPAIGCFESADWEESGQKIFLLLLNGMKPDLRLKLFCVFHFCPDDIARTRAGQ